MEIIEKIKNIIIGKIGKDSFAQAENNGLVNSINSLTFIKILLDIETAFEIEIDDEYLNLNHFETLSDLYDYIRIKLNS